MGFHLKIWADEYAFPAEVKGGSVRIRPENIWVTSNCTISDIWGDDPSICEPLKRRFQEVHFQTIGQQLFAPANEVEVRSAYAPGFVPHVPDASIFD